MDLDNDRDAALIELLHRSRGPAGPDVDADFDRPAEVWQQLRRMLAASNGFALFNAGVQVFRAGPVGVGPDLQSWNAPNTWKDTYGGLTGGLFCFGQDLFGVQFAIDEAGQVVSFDPESADRTVIGSDLNAWAAWLLSDPAGNGAGTIATGWQDRFGALGHDERLIPRQFFVLGGSYRFDNLRVEDATTAMRIRGPIARQVHELPDGAAIRLEVD